MCMVGYHHFKKNSHQFLFIKRVFNLVLNKIDYGVFKLKNSLLKPKINLLN
jgi:hypothetical protein